MARRYNRRQSTIPPKPVTVKPIAVDVAGLTTAYEWLALNKTVGLRMALDWYATNRPLLVVGNPLSGDRLKTYQRAEKSRAQGDGTTYEAEQETAYYTAIRLYEKLWAAEKSLPLIDTAVATTPSQRMLNIQSILTGLNAAYGPAGLSFGVTAGDTRLNTTGSCLLPQKELDTLVGQPLLKTVMGEVVNVAKRISTVEHKVNAGEQLPDGTVNETGVPQIFQRLDGRAFMTNIDSVMSSAVNWAGTLNGALGAAVGNVHTPKAARKPRDPNAAPAAPRAPRPSNLPSSVDPLGVFKANTVKAAISSLLNDGAVHTLAEIEALCTQYSVVAATAVFDTFFNYAKKGIAFNLTRNGSPVSKARQADGFQLVK